MIIMNFLVQYNLNLNAYYACINWYDLYSLSATGMMNLKLCKPHIAGAYRPIEQAVYIEINIGI